MKPLTSFNPTHWVEADAHKTLDTLQVDGGVLIPKHGLTPMNTFLHARTLDPNPKGPKATEQPNASESACVFLCEKNRATCFRLSAKTCRFVRWGVRVSRALNLAGCRVEGFRVGFAAVDGFRVLGQTHEYSSEDALNFIRL